MIAHHALAESETQVSGYDILDVIPWLSELARESTAAHELAEAWIYIDPIGSGYLHEDDMSMSFASLNGANASMPDVYQSLVAQYWSMEEDDFEDHAVAVMGSYLPDSVAHLSYVWCEDAHTFDYLPFQAYGEAWDNPDWIPPMNLESIMPIFGYEYSEDDDQYIDQLRNNSRWKACSVLIHYLESTDDVVNHNVAMFLRWAFCGTGNELTDWDEYSFYENGIEYFGWYDLDRAILFQEEADEIYAMVEAGMQALNADPIYLHTLDSNYKTIYRSIAADDTLSEQTIAEFKYHEFTQSIQPQWLTYCGKSDGTRTETQGNARILRLWRDSTPRGYQLSY